MSISAWPAVATSWWCFSTWMPAFSISRIISVRMSCWESVGATGKYPSLWRGLCPRLGPRSLPDSQIPSSDST